jgi:hypothetical protein
MEPDASLCLAARLAAQQYVQIGPGGETRVIAELDRDLARFFAVFAKTSSIVFYAADIEEARDLLQPADGASPTSFPILDPATRLAGIAVESSPGGNPSTSRAGLAVVIILAQS